MMGTMNITKFEILDTKIELTQLLKNNGFSIIDKSTYNNPCKFVVAVNNKHILAVSISEQGNTSYFNTFGVFDLAQNNNDFDTQVKIAKLYTFDVLIKHNVQPTDEKRNEIIKIAKTLFHG